MGDAGVDSVGGHHAFAVLAEVGGREAEFAAAGVAVDDGSGHGVRGAEHLGGGVDAAFGQQLAHQR